MHWLVLYKTVLFVGDNTHSIVVCHIKCETSCSMYCSSSNAHFNDVCICLTNHYLAFYILCGSRGAKNINWHDENMICFFLFSSISLFISKEVYLNKVFSFVADFVLGVVVIFFLRNLLLYLLYLLNLV